MTWSSNEGQDNSIVHGAHVAHGAPAKGISRVVVAAAAVKRIIVFEFLSARQWERERERHIVASVCDEKLPWEYTGTHPRHLQAQLSLSYIYFIRRFNPKATFPSQFLLYTPPPFSLWVTIFLLTREEREMNFYIVNDNIHYLYYLLLFIKLKKELQKIYIKDKRGF